MNMKNENCDTETKKDTSLRYCQYCSKGYKNVKTLKRHENSHKLQNDLNEIENETMEHRRVDNKKKIKNSTTIKKHLRPKVIKCRICPDTVLHTEVDYLFHVNEVHKGKHVDYYMCSDCGKQFKTKSELTSHITSKCGTIKQFKCRVCDQELMTSGSLHNHMLRHNGEPSFMCRFCAKLFLTAGQLKVHERIHTQEKVFVCNVCGKGFCHRQSLITHSSLHTGIKPYLCENCGNSFSCVGNLLKHRKTHADSCGLMPLTTHRVKHPSTRMKVKINTPANSKLKQMKKEKELQEKLNSLKVKKLEQEKEPENICISENNADENDINMCKSEENMDGTCADKQEELKNEDFNEFDARNEEDCAVPDNPDKTEDSKTNQKSDVHKQNEKNYYITHEDSEHERNDLNVNTNLSKPEVSFSDKDSKADDSPMVENDLLESFETSPRTDFGSHNSDSEDSMDLASRLSNNTDLADVTKHSNEKMDLIGVNFVVGCTKDFENAFCYDKKSTKTSRPSRKSTKTSSRRSSKVNGESIIVTELEVEQLRKERGIKDKGDIYCQYCTKSYNNPRWLLRHEKVHREQEVENDKVNDKNDLGDEISTDKEFRCCCCKATFDTRDECKSHQNDAHAEILSCQCCDKIFSNPDSLRTHKKRFHKGVRRKVYIYVCERCGKQFKQKSALMCHEENNCGTGPLFQCNICEKKFSSGHVRKSHMRIHDGEKKLLCKFCGKSFHWKGQLKIHERSHTGEKPFSCLYCPKAFAYRESLITHSSIHTGIKPHLCAACGSRFSCLGNLIKHRATHMSTCGAWFSKNKT